MIACRCVLVVSLTYLLYSVSDMHVCSTVVYNIEPKDYNAFQKFNRTFIWNMKPPATKTLHLNFSSTGLRQIQPTDSCPDKHVYTLAVENVSVGRFCQNGAIRQVDVRNVGKLSLEVSGGRPLDKKVIGVSLGRLINCKYNGKLIYLCTNCLNKVSICEMLYFILQHWLISMLLSQRGVQPRTSLPQSLFLKAQRQCGILLFPTRTTLMCTFWATLFQHASNLKTSLQWSTLGRAKTLWWNWWM